MLDLEPLFEEYVQKVKNMAGFIVIKDILEYASIFMQDPATWDQSIQQLFALYSDRCAYIAKHTPNITVMVISPNLVNF